MLKLPMLEGKLVPMEFAGLTILKEADATYRGGCVTAVGGYFRARKGLSEAYQRAEELAVINAVRSRIDGNSPKVNDVQTIITSLVTSNEKVKSGSTLSPEELQTYVKASADLQKQLAVWQDQIKELLGNGTASTAITTQVTDLMASIKAATDAIIAGKIPDNFPDVKGIMANIVDQIKKQLDKPTDTLPQITNVQASKITDQSATISWTGDKRFTKYIVTYQKPGEGERVVEVTNPKVTLSDLEAGSEYEVKVLGIEKNFKKFETKIIQFVTANYSIPPP